jgi:OOP family OmpA-OmpF porin
MKKNVLSVLVTVLSVSALFAQKEQDKKENVSKEFNHWSMDINSGISKPMTPFTPKQHVSDLNLFHVDLGARYMFNNKFGVKLDFGYDQYKNDSGSALKFDGQYFRTDFQGVANLGRLLNFEDWTQRLNLQAHMGAGYSFMKNDTHNGADNMANFLVGLTGQIKLSERVALNADFTLVNNVRQHYTYDGVRIDLNEDRGFNGTLYNASLGLSIYLGKNKKHADWYVDEKLDEKLANVENRIGELETMMNDSDKDGVPDYLDAENNSITGIAVDTKGRMVDLNNNSVPDELEKFISTNYVDKAESVSNNSEMVKKLINDGYVSTYFDSKKSVPTNVSTEGIDYILTYLRNNPSASIEIIGNADEIGKSENNNKLAIARANSVKNILVKAGIAATRLTIVSKGEDTTVDKDSEGARKLVRRVTFRVK